MALKTVAVLDDDYAMLELYKTILIEEGYKVVPIAYTRNFAALIASIRQAQASLLILDIRIPGVNSFEVVQALETDPTTPAPQIMICSASHKEILATEQKIREQGLPVPAVLEKPFDLDNFLELVIRLLN